jgi:hypothetical protein
LVSGHGRAQLSQPFADAPLLSKPFHPDNLVRAIRQVLP